MPAAGSAATTSRPRAASQGGVAAGAGADVEPDSVGPGWEEIGRGRPDGFGRQRLVARGEVAGVKIVEGDGGVGRGHRSICCSTSRSRSYPRGRAYQSQDTAVPISPTARTSASRTSPSSAGNAGSRATACVTSGRRRSKAKSSSSTASRRGAVAASSTSAPVPAVVSKACCSSRPQRAGASWI